MQEAAGRLVSNTKIGKDARVMKILCDAVARESEPGHFVMIAPTGAYDPLLKRPFGIMDADPPYIWVYYQIVGRGTRLIGEKRRGDTLSLIGPLGNRFPERERSTILLIAGGRGIAPLHFAAKRYAEKNKVYLVYGAATGDDLHLGERLPRLGIAKIYEYTEDGSRGSRGNVCLDLPRIVATHGIRDTFSCGPDAMLQALAGHLDGKTENFISCEAIMGCGFGICHSCIIKTVTGEYKKVCTDGPVFRLEEIAW